MDKEAIERIAKEIQEAQDCRDEISPLGTAGEILKILEELDYHKFPQGKPPLLSNEEIGKQIDGLLWDIADGTFYGIKEGTTIECKVSEFYENWMAKQRNNIQAQREADIAFYEGK